ncbi:MAG: hypothetical protein IKD08_06105 [Alphaproteobacteria bacterium]|nr:hypothetical protein [Alphaproteobacteria bacterium]
MDDISALLKEAKPLYFTRKQRRQQVKKGLSCAACIAFAGAIFIPYWQSSSEDIAFSLYDVAAYDEAFDYQGSVIKDMGLPTDDFGLLMVL